MSGASTRILIIIGLLVAAATHGSIAAAASDRGIGTSMTGMDAANCDMTKNGKLKPIDCAAFCAVATADIARVATLPHLVLRRSWRLADLSADGIEPSPDPTPPRA